MVKTASGVCQRLKATLAEDSPEVMAEVAVIADPLDVATNASMMLRWERGGVKVGDQGEVAEVAVEANSLGLEWAERTEVMMPVIVEAGRCG